MNIPDFSSSQTPATSELLSKLAIMTVAWIVLLSAIEKISSAIATIFWSHSIPIDKASIPSKLPHPNPPGSAVPFDVPLQKATEEQIEAFMAFRGITSAGGGDGKMLQLVADEAAGYKGLLYQERTMKWIDDHFRLREPNLKYPYVGRHWNGWRSFYTETGPHIRKMFLASITVTFEHTINGLLLPMLYLITHDDIYFNLALYSEVGYMIYATSLILASYVLKRDVTVEQMHEAVWILLLIHHLASISICVACIIIEGVPKELACWGLLVLLGLTSTLHYVGQILDFSPLAQSNAPYTRLYNHLFCLASQIVFRCIYWTRICYLALVHCWETQELGTTVALVSVMVLFTLFNVDFVKFHVKATQGCWGKIQQEKLAKDI